MPANGAADWVAMRVSAERPVALERAGGIELTGDGRLSTEGCPPSAAVRLEVRLGAASGL